MRWFLVFPLFFTLSCYAKHSSVVIIGGGVGGLSAAITLCRTGVMPLVLEGKLRNGAFAEAHAVENWPTEFRLSGSELIAKIREKALMHGAVIEAREVIAVDFTTHPFKLTVEDLISKEQAIIESDACIIATGSTPAKLGASGEELYWQKGIYLCPVCDGHLLKDKRAAVVGDGDRAIAQVDSLSSIAAHVILIAPRNRLFVEDELRKNRVLSRPNVRVCYNAQIKELYGNGKKLSGLIIEESPSHILSEMEVDGLFLATLRTPNSMLFEQQLELDRQGYICLKQGQQTSIPGVFAVGDVVDPLYGLAICAAGDGAKAALDAKRYLSSMKTPESTKLPAARRQKSKVIDIPSEDAFERAIQTATTPLLVDFYAEGCEFCQELSLHFDAWAEHFAGKITFLKINLCVAGGLIEKYQFESTPTILFFERGGTLAAVLDRETIHPFIKAQE